MATRDVKAPSGLKGLVRGLKGKEANLLADRVLARKLTTFDEVLNNCWLKTEDGGRLAEHYAAKLRGSEDVPRLDWSKVLIGDRTVALVQIRIATYGPKYVFKRKCESCGESFECELDLETELDYKELPEESIQKFLDGNRFPAEFPDGTKFVFSLSTGASERQAAKRADKKKDEKITVSLSERIVEIDGIGENKRKIRAYLEDVDLSDQYDIIDILDEADGGYETDIEVECSECGWEQIIRLPFGADFWTRPKRLRRKAAEED